MELRPVAGRRTAARRHDVTDACGGRRRQEEGADSVSTPSGRPRMGYVATLRERAVRSTPGGFDPVRLRAYASARSNSARRRLHARSACASWYTCVSGGHQPWSAPS